MSTIRFRLNGESIEAEGLDPHKSLLHFLRDSGRTGSKEGCAEGECGACAVVVRREGPDGPRFVAINSCLVLMPALEGKEVWSVEGVGSPEQLHPVQDAMVKLGGSQCGYCTPGFVMSMFAEYYREGRDGYDPESISGNLCRCTGYRPIRDAVKGFGQPDESDQFVTLRKKPVQKLEASSYEANGNRFDRPDSLAALFAILEASPNATLISGGTDLVVYANQDHRRFEHLVSLEAIAELRHFELADDALIIGAGVPLAEVEERIHGKVPILEQLFPLFSSRLIRNRATLGGNLGTASPIGDSPPALLALGASLVLAGKDGEREVPLNNFFTGYRQTDLNAGEIIKEVRIPRPLPDIARFYKVSKRVMDDISTVAAGFSLSLDGGFVSEIRIAYGGIAATPVRAHDAEAAMSGNPWNETTLALGIAALSGEGFTPMSDHRGSADYRESMIIRLLEKFFYETRDEGRSAAE